MSNLLHISSFCVICLLWPFAVVLGQGMLFDELDGRSSAGSGTDSYDLCREIDRAILSDDTVRLQRLFDYWWKELENKSCADTTHLFNSAVEHGSLEVLRHLCSSGYKSDTIVDIDGCTPLQRAIESHEFRIVSVLLENSVQLGHKNNRGRTAMHDACLIDDGEIRATIIRQLLKAGSPVSFSDDSGKTPLHLIASRCGSSSIEMLLAAGADINAVDNAGNTPLHLSTMAHCLGTTRSLLHAGADPNMRNHAGQFACDLISEDDYGEDQYYDLMPMFKSRGAPCEKTKEPVEWKEIMPLGSIRLTWLGSNKQPKLHASFTLGNDQCAEPRRRYPRFSYGFEPFSIGIPSDRNLFQTYGFSWYHAAADAGALGVIALFRLLFPSETSYSIGEALGVTGTNILVGSPLWVPPLLANMQADFGTEIVKIGTGWNTDIYIWRKKAILFYPHVSLKVAVPGNIIVEGGALRFFSNDSALLSGGPYQLFIRIGLGCFDY